MSMTPAQVRSLSAASDLDLGCFKPDHLAARVARAIHRAKVVDVESLAVGLRADARLRAEFRRSVAISVTGFFRDEEQFEHLERHLGWLRDVERPRVWSAGCSNGSELWTLAVVLDRLGVVDRAQLLGSDLLPENVARARGGLDDGILAGHTLPANAKPYFEVRDLVRQPVSPGPWHVILCRNVAIYFEAEARQDLHARFAAALAPGGLLLLGRSERISDPRSLGLERAAPHLYRRTA